MEAAMIQPMQKEVLTFVSHDRAQAEKRKHWREHFVTSVFQIMQVESYANVGQGQSENAN